ncbi:mitochondrial chaperone BCS1 [Vigna unguiculata]|uniref:Mitochondrial chaperone BCS1 n=1 Tax=Vigna unguiculata TaxID=3917 RepID=A0A4D6L4F7_VIGUN|nr:mitochondrial chaperone BCS1 [Vigna unguiculata]
MFKPRAKGHSIYSPINGGFNPLHQTPFPTFMDPTKTHPPSISHSHNTLLCFPQETCLIMLLRSMANELIPHPIHRYLFNTFTLIIEESTTIARHQVYNVTEAYLYTRVSTQNERLKISKSPKEKKLTICLEKR